MIVGSLLLILIAGTLLVLGLASGSSVLLVTSIATSLLAAVALVVGARQAIAGRAAPGRADEAPARRAGDVDADRRRPAAGGQAADPVGQGAAEGMRADEPVSTTVPRQGAYGSSGGEAGRWEPAGDPTPPATGGGRAPDAAAGVLSDEPAAQVVAPAEAAKVARLFSDVLVIDGRPRYHLPGCDHLRGRESEPLPVSEAVELGFTPCAKCEPNSALLADAR